MARSFKFRIEKVEALYNVCSENRGADLRLCFRICKRGSLVVNGGQKVKY